MGTIRASKRLVLISSLYFVLDPIVLCKNTVVASESVASILLNKNGDINSNNEYLPTLEIKKGIISFPLIHRDQVIARRRRELRLEKIRLVQEEQKVTHADGNNSSSTNTTGAAAENSKVKKLEEEISSAATSEEEGGEDDWPQVITPLFQGMGTHFVDLYIGTPIPQRQTLIVDTGSGIVAFPCKPCNDCGKSYHTDGAFDPDNSTTFDAMDCEKCQLGTCKHLEEFDYCGMSMGYAEGSSWHAYESSDFVYAGTSHSERRRLRMSSYHNGRRGVGKSGHGKKLRSGITSREEQQEEQEYDDFQITSSQFTGYSKNLPSSSYHRKTQQHDTKDLEAEFKKEAAELKAKYESTHHTSNYAPSKDFSFELRFGCQYKIRGLFKTQLADGIMGMENSEKSFWRQMYDAGMITSKRFSLCFTHSELVSKKGVSAGTMSLGGADPTMHSSTMVYAENIPSNDWFSIKVQNMYLKHPKKMDEIEGSSDFIRNATARLLLIDDHPVQKLDFNPELLSIGGVILDSGTTESYFPPYVKVPFVNAFKELMGFDFIPQVTKESNITVEAHYPTIIIQLKAAIQVEDSELMEDNGNPFRGLAGTLDLDHPNDVILEIPPDHYMLWSTKAQAFTNRFHMDDSSSVGVLGANSMYGNDILFDVDKNRIGIAKSNCILPK